MKVLEAALAVEQPCHHHCHLQTREMTPACTRWPAHGAILTTITVVDNQSTMGR
jgi:hypothetical protein